MKKVRQIFALLLLLIAAGGTYLYTQMKSGLTIKLSESQINTAMAKKFPLEKEYLLLNVTLELQVSWRSWIVWRSIYLRRLKPRSHWPSPSAIKKLASERRPAIRPLPELRARSIIILSPARSTSKMPKSLK